MHVVVELCSIKYFLLPMKLKVHSHTHTATFLHMEWSADFTVQLAFVLLLCSVQNALTCCCILS